MRCYPHESVMFPPDNCPDCHRDTYGREPAHGMCTACGAVEVALNRATGTRDLSDIGEAADYPTGYGCEVCA